MAKPKREDAAQSWLELVRYFEFYRLVKNYSQKGQNPAQKSKILHQMANLKCPPSNPVRNKEQILAKLYELVDGEIMLKFLRREDALVWLKFIISILEPGKVGAKSQSDQSILLTRYAVDIIQRWTIVAELAIKKNPQISNVIRFAEEINLQSRIQSVIGSIAGMNSDKSIKIPKGCARSLYDYHYFYEHDDSLKIWALSVATRSYIRLASNMQFENVKRLLDSKSDDVGQDQPLANDVVDVLLNLDEILGSLMDKTIVIKVLDKYIGGKDLVSKRGAVLASILIVSRHVEEITSPNNQLWKELFYERIGDLLHESDRQLRIEVCWTLCMYCESFKNPVRFQTLLPLETFKSLRNCLTNSENHDVVGYITRIMSMIKAPYPFRHKEICKMMSLLTENCGESFKNWCWLLKSFENCALKALQEDATLLNTFSHLAPMLREGSNKPVAPKNKKSKMKITRFIQMGGVEKLRIITEVVSKAKKKKSKSKNKGSNASNNNNNQQF